MIPLKNPKALTLSQTPTGVVIRGTWLPAKGVPSTAPREQRMSKTLLAFSVGLVVGKDLIHPALRLDRIPYTPAFLDAINAVAWRPDEAWDAWVVRVVVPNLTPAQVAIVQAIAPAQNENAKAWIEQVVAPLVTKDQLHTILQSGKPFTETHQSWIDYAGGPSILKLYGLS